MKKMQTSANNLALSQAIEVYLQIKGWLPIN